MSKVIKEPTHNKFHYTPTHDFGVYQCFLNFKEEYLQKIIADIYKLEQDPKKRYHSTGRTF